MLIGRHKQAGVMGRWGAVSVVRDGRLASNAAHREVVTV